MATLILEILPRFDLLNFLKMSIHTNFREKTMHTINLTFLTLFSKPIEFRNAVSSNTKISKDVKTEYILFFDVCNKNGFENFTEFEFKTDLKNKIKTSIEF